MAELEPGLAQGIVERLMPIIHHNVNVIDGRGVIIGSGNRRRIGTVHEGSFVAIHQRRTVEFDEDAAARLHGVEAGVNMPLCAAGGIIGVIGITGFPEQVRPLADLTLLTAEMMVEKSQLMRAPSGHARFCEILATQMIEGRPLTAEQTDWARRLRIDPARPRVAAVVRITSDRADLDEIARDMQTARAALAEADPDGLIAVVSLDEMAVLLPVNGSPATQPSGTGAFRQRIGRLARHLRHCLPASLTIGIGVGQTFEGPDAPGRSYRSARATLRIAAARDCPGPVHFYEDHKVPVLLSGLDGTWQAGELRSLMDRLAARDRHGELRRTLSVWLAHDRRPTETAAALGVHRNTLLYRLARIGDITGLDLDRLDACFLLYAALQGGSA
ncbi:MAG: carbohydrate diacid regulon transcriptional regulator CdaR [Telmatospirillum sp.]|nr:carbohydrate diacid regulon transcriptional regulator CdaR [Telmatospirillum sp.]